MNKIIVTGCKGQLGIAINKLYEGNREIELVNTDVEELDITDIGKVLAFVREVKPYAIINCAAHTNVNACEKDVDNAYRINAIGPRNLSIAAAETGAKLMQVSTDYVFAGNGDRPYTEFDATSPLGVYGGSKLAGENFVRDFAKNYFIVRTAWLYGEGKNFVKTMLKLAENHEEITVVSDQFGSPTSAVELAKMIHFLEPTENYGTYHATCEGQCSWADFAVEIFSAGFSFYTRKTDIELVSTMRNKSFCIIDISECSIKEIGLIVEWCRERDYRFVELSNDKNKVAMRIL